MERWSRSTIRWALRQLRNASVDVLTYSTIVSEAELKTVLCSCASGLMLLNCMKTDPARFAVIKNLVVVGNVSSELQQCAAQNNVAVFSFVQLVEEGRGLAEEPFAAPTGEDMAMICYTSGTTGVPKGAMLTHENMVAVTTAVIDYMNSIGGFSNADAHISYLPMAHVFEHFVQCGMTFFGARIGFYQVRARATRHT